MKTGCKVVKVTSSLPCQEVVYNINELSNDIPSIFADIDNPTSDEVETWAQANLDIKRVNGSRITYNVPDNRNIISDGSYTSVYTILDLSDSGIGDFLVNGVGLPNAPYQIVDGVPSDVWTGGNDATFISDLTTLLVSEGVTSPVVTAVYTFGTLQELTITITGIDAPITLEPFLYFLSGASTSFGETYRDSVFDSGSIQQGTVDDPDYVWTINLNDSDIETTSEDERRNYQGRVRYVTTNGSDSQSKVGYTNYPAGDIFYHSQQNNRLDTDVIVVKPGVYIGSVYSNAIQEGVHKFHLEAGAEIRDVEFSGGSGDPGSELHITGNGKLIQTSGNLFYNSFDVVKIEVDSIETTGANFAIWSGGVKETELNIKYLKTQGRVTFTSRIGDNGRETVNIDYIHHDFTESSSHAPIRQQFTELHNAVSDISVGTILSENLADSVYQFQNDTVPFTNNTTSFSCNNIISTNAGVSTTPDFDLNGLGGEILAVGGSSTIMTDSTHTINVDNIKSSATSLQILSLILTRSQINANFGSVVNLLNPNIILSGPGDWQDNSTVVITGDFISDSANVMISEVTIDSTSLLVFKDCRFKTTAPGKANIQFGFDPVNYNGRVLFDNCTFINDGVHVAIESNLGGVNTVQAVFKNCSTNTAAIDVSIQELGEAIDRQLTFI